VARQLPAAGALLSALGCATIQPVGEPAQYIQQSQPQEVYVTFKNHSKVTLMRPRVSSDSIYGTVAGVAHPLAAPLTHVERIEAMQRDRARTRWLVAGVGVLALGSVAVFTLGGSGGSDCDATYYRSPCYAFQLMR
jgi:hypothetical protein